MLTKNEEHSCGIIERRVNELRQFLNTHELEECTNFVSWYKYLNSMKGILGNFDNNISYVATLLAKQYITNHFKILPFDAAEKPQGAPGMDIDITTREGKRIIGQIKTTMPYGKNDFGSNQKTHIKKDLESLKNSRADYKFMFVTEFLTFELLKEKYLSPNSGLKLVNLLSDKEYGQ
jgi:hypothetical protein